MALALYTPLVVLLTVCVGSAQPFICPLRVIDPDVFRVAQLQRPEQEGGLRHLLAGNRDTSPEMFYLGDRLRPALRGLLQDADVGDRAALILSLIAEPEDIQAIIRTPPRPRKAAFENRWAYSVATALLDPTSDMEWSFLRRCALNEFNDRWVDAGAIQTLKLIASPRSRGLLLEAQRVNSYRTLLVARALEYIDSGPMSFSGPDLQALARHVAEAVRVGTLIGGSSMQCDENGNRALVDFTFEAGSDRLIYTATFHKSDSNWHLRAVRETMQMLVAHPTLVPNRKGH